MKIALMILQLIPGIIAVITAIEEQFEGAGRGAEKLAAVKKILEQVYPQIMGAWETLEGVIAILVNLFNTIGTFKK